jgi:hypothetical protein
MVRWWWFGPAVQKPEILHELQQMKADGIGGAELAFVYPQVLDDPAKNLKNLPFLSQEMLDAVTYANTEAHRLGLRIDVTLCSGWPYGGPHITLQEAATRLRTLEIPLPATATQLPTPKLAEGESILATFIANGTPTPPTPRGHHDDPSPTPTWDPTTAITPTTPIPPSTTPRVALYFIQSHTKQEVKRAAVDAEGYVLDPFSQRAVAHHLTAVGEPLLQAFGPPPPTPHVSDSLEAYGADWTPNLPAEFLKRRGYDLIPHLPELVAGGTPAAEKIRHDYGQTLTELVSQNYLTQINQWALAHHTKFRSQTYGEPAVTFSSQNLASLAEGEGPQWRAFSTLRWATSANHVYGHTVTSGETFTWLHSPVFRATPLDMKAEADIDFIMGENQLIFHGWPYSPPNHEVPEPGWSLYAAAVFNDHNPWHPVMPAVTQYITRVSALLRQGQPANQVAILLPTDDAWASFSPGRTGQVSITAAMQKLITPELMSTILSAGYNIDYIDAEAIDKAGLGTHQILIIPPTDRIPVETLRNIAQWRKKQGDVICYQRCPTIDPAGKPLPGMTGSFFVADNPAALTKDLNEAYPPDLLLDDHQGFPVRTPTQDVVGFIRRTLPDADLYFVANTTNYPINTTATFSARYHAGEGLDPASGTSTKVVASGQYLHLEAYESRVFIFSDHIDPSLPSTPNQTSYHTLPADAWPHYGPRDLVADLTHDWTVTFTGSARTAHEPTLTDWTADPTTEHYSGEAIYTRDIDLPSLPKTPIYLEVTGGHPEPGTPTAQPTHVLLPNGLPDPKITRPGPGMHAFYDPPIHEAALVTINGQPAGALWHPPYKLEVTRLLKPGQNHIEIHVYNTALNAWSALPPHDYKPLIEKYGDRFQMQDLDKVHPIASGLLGQIHLTTEPAQ